MQKLQGLFAPIPTFLDEHGDIDVDGNLIASKKLLQTSIDGLFVLGTTGEFPYFTMEEKKHYMEMFSENLSQSKPIVCCVSHWSQKKALELTDFALEKGFKYISALLPLYFPISDEKILEYYRAIRKRIDEFDSSIPFIFYHIPVFQAAANVKPELIIQLANEGVVQGLKNSTPDMEHAREIIENTRDEFTFFCGTEPLLFHGFRDGHINAKFDGGIFSALNVMPNTYKSLFKATKELDRDEFARIWPLVDEFIALFDHGVTYLPQITKYAMKIAGYNILDTVREPLGIIGKDIQKQITKIVQKIQSYWGSMQI
ncbi:MAG: dihydrodipicolinate synthase family protein [Promethearchaeota archaeon]